ncbi:hypothetical protein N9T61_00950 [Flavobacteriaceae bacterium]|jgi:hypothetical protein|nr:hypothetical protein [Flavobacteriaceae bacterium]
MRIKILAYTFLGGKKEYIKEFRDKSDLDKHISFITNEDSLFRDVQYTYKDKDYRVFNKKRNDSDYVSKYRKTQADNKAKLFKKHSIITSINVTDNMRNKYKEFLKTAILSEKDIKSARLILNESSLKESHIVVLNALVDKSRRFKSKQNKK